MKLLRMALTLGLIAGGCVQARPDGTDLNSGDIPIVFDSGNGDLFDIPGDIPFSDAPGQDSMSDALPRDNTQADGVPEFPPGDTAVDAVNDATMDPGVQQDSAQQDTGPTDTPCVRATACGDAATCNLSSGKCESRSPGWSPFALLSVYPTEGAPGDMIVIDGANFNMFTSVTAGGSTLSKDADENRIVATRGDNSNGDLKVGGSTWNTPIVTSANHSAQQACLPSDPPATGAFPTDPSEAGPWAAGFADYKGSFGAKVRVFYPATCGGLRKPPAEGKFPFVYFVHGDGYVALNFEYLARHLATWGFMSAIPDNADYTSFNSGRTSPGQWFAPLAGHETDSDAVIVCHSMGATYTHDLGLANVRGVVFLGPVYSIEDPYGSLFPIQGLVIGWSNDGQSPGDKCWDAYQQIYEPKYMALIIGGNHGQFIDDKMWDTPSDGSGAFIPRNRQHELTQAFTLAWLQRVFGQTEPFAQWLTDPGLPSEVTLESSL